jgi:hypothetical protein
MLEDDGDREGDEIKLFESIVKLFDKALTYPKLQDLEQLYFPWNVLMQIRSLNSNVTCRWKS